MKNLILVFLGGGLGSTLRYLVGAYFNSTQKGIPYGTLIANVLGCLIIGFVLGLAAKDHVVSQSQTLFLATGFCGGFTTFSTFAYENHAFLKVGDFTTLALYTIASIVFGFLATFVGLYIARIA